MSPPLLSVIVPTRNEAANVTVLIGRLREALTSVPFELCFVDDSDDETGALLARLADERDDVHCVLRQGEQRAGGLSTAVVAGLRLATGVHVCVIDADLQHPPELIPEMLKVASEGADLVVASRYAGDGTHEGLDGPVRRLVSRSAKVVAQVLFPEANRSSDPLSGFFLCRRALIDGVEFRPVGFKILLELLVLLPQHVRVRDVPLHFQPRQRGSSKATARQGLLYLQHIRSLFMDVKGSARMWKFAIVGSTGLAVFLSLLAVLHRVFGFDELDAFLPAFAASVAWNTTLNVLWTFADMRRQAGGDGPGRYLRSAVLSGLLMFVLYAVLVTALHRLVVAGAAAAMVAMAVNGAVNWRSVRRRPSGWSEVAVNEGVQAALARLALLVSADRAYALPVGSRPAGTVPPELLARVASSRRPGLWTEAASYRPQRRTNIEVTSALVLPVVQEDEVLAVVVCERHAKRSFDHTALEIATGAVDGIRGPLADAMPSRDGPGRPAAHPGARSAARP